MHSQAAAAGQRLAPARLLALIGIALVPSLLAPRCATAGVRAVGEVIDVGTVAAASGRWVTALPLASGGFVVLWPGMAATEASAFDAAGRPLAQPIALPSAAGAPIATTLGDSIVLESGASLLSIGLDGRTLRMQTIEPPPFTRAGAIAAAPGGALALAWDFIDPIGIYATALAADGAAQSFVVTDSSPGNSWPFHPAVAALAADRFVVAWVAVNSGAVWARAVGPGGVAADAFPIAAELDAPSPPALCGDAGSGVAVAAWHTDEPTQLRRVDANGPLSAVWCSALHGEPALACAPNGLTLVSGSATTAAAQTALVVRAVDAAGLPRGQLVLPLDGGASPASSLVALSAGTAAAVAWSDCAASGAAGECRIRAQVLAADGVAACQGDCDDDGQVTVDELVTAVGTVLSDPTALLRCPALARDLRSCAAGVADVVGAVGNALRGCS
jgi:hypothetical protein